MNRQEKKQCAYVCANDDKYNVILMTKFEWRGNSFGFMRSPTAIRTHILYIYVHVYMLPVFEIECNVIITW